MPNPERTPMPSTPTNGSDGRDESPGGQQPRREIVKSREEVSLQLLFSLIDAYAPHLRESFVRSDAWWRKHHALPEAHVSSGSPFF
jgi:hypothetical protein